MAICKPLKALTCAAFKSYSLWQSGSHCNGDCTRATTSDVLLSDVEDWSWNFFLKELQTLSTCNLQTHCKLCILLLAAVHASCQSVADGCPTKTLARSFLSVCRQELGQWPCLARKGFCCPGPAKAAVPATGVGKGKDTTWTAFLYLGITKLQSYK